MKKIVCIECPNGCILSLDIKNGRVTGVLGNKCEKGSRYAHEEVENPRRVLTSSVLTQGLPLKMIPVRTNKPIPKALLRKAMQKIKTTTIKRNITVGDIIIKNILHTGADLIATRSINKRGQT